jgi:putative ABC transport system permease protein
MIRTLANLYRADPGYSTERILTATWVLPGAAYADATKRAPVIERALQRLEAVPGVRAVAMVNPLPLSGSGNQNSYYVEGSPVPETGRHPSTEVFQASGNLFDTLRMPLVAGRVFGPQDTPTSPRVAIVDTMFVEKNLKGQDPIGKRFVFGGQPPQKDTGWIQIVGVVAHIQNYGLGRDTREQVYTAAPQTPPSYLTFILRTDRAPATVATALRSAMHEVAPDLPVFGIQTMDELFINSISTQRLTVFLLGTFAALALLLAALGLYGVLAYNVSQRTREIGIRMALGATSRSVVGLILRHGFKFAGLGLVLGLGLALVFAQVMRTLLYEVSPFDPLAFALVAAALSVIGGVACWLPARRATRVDPMTALRTE